MSSDFAKTRVLIVDRTPYGRRLLRGILVNLAVQKVETCDDAAGALRLLRQERFDLVFCDEWMKPMSAEAFLSAVRHDVQSCDMTVPVIMVTAGTDRGHIEKVRDAGVNDVIVKPVSTETVRRKVQAHLGPERRKDGERRITWRGPDRRRPREATADTVPPRVPTD